MLFIGWHNWISKKKNEYLYMLIEKPNNWSFYDENGNGDNPCIYIIQKKWGMIIEEGIVKWFALNTSSLYYITR